MREMLSLLSRSPSRNSESIHFQARRKNRSQVCDIIPSNDVAEMFSKFEFLYMLEYLSHHLTSQLISLVSERPSSWLFTRFFHTSSYLFFSDSASDNPDSTFSVVFPVPFRVFGGFFHFSSFKFPNPKHNTVAHKRFRRTLWCWDEDWKWDWKWGWAEWLFTPTFLMTMSIFFLIFFWLFFWPP